MEEINVYHLRTVGTEKVVGDKVIKMGGKPYGTVAIEINSDGTVNRGVSICSENDVYVKRVGIKKAVGRLKSAKKRKYNINHIDSFRATQKKILKKIGGVAKFTNTTFDFLGGYHVEPTEDEKTIFRKEFNNLDINKDNLMDML